MHDLPEEGSRPVRAARDQAGSALPSPAYGASAALLLERVLPMLDPVVERAVERFYARIGSEPASQAVLARLTPRELARLKVRQADHLRSLLDPALDAQRSLERARQVGRVHAMVGVETDWYASAVVEHLQGLREAIDEWASPTDRAALNAVLGERLARDLQGALLGFRDIDAQQSRALVRVNKVVAEAETIADLARGVLEALDDLEGVVDGYFGRPGPGDRFQFEVAVGGAIEAFMAGASGPAARPITTLSAHSTGQGPAGRAWRSGDIERSDAYLTDPATAPWHALGRRFGWRSSAAVPLVDPRGAPRALLSLYARWPGYFTYSSRMAFLVQLKQIVEQALVRLEGRAATASGVVAYEARTAHLERLERGEVVMLYQPVVELATGRLLKLEALARLRGKERLVSPAEFLPAFGDGELLRLFEIGLDQSLRALSTWEAAGLETGVSLNLPTTCSSDRRYVALVEGALTRYGIAPSRLTLELLETGSLEGGSGWRGQALVELQALGVRLAEDDLGSGYSSLLRLRSIAFDEVKVDQELVRGAERSPREALNFIQPLTSLAHSMGLTVVVEGLETQGLIEAAVFLGADAGQGYGIARPLGAEAVPDWSRTFRLDIDRERPRTSLGGLAAHLAWENRLAVLAPTPALRSRATDDTCPLTSYIAGLGDASGPAERGHQLLHAAVAGRAGSVEYGRSWERLTALLGGEG